MLLRWLAAGHVFPLPTQLKVRILHSRLCAGCTIFLASPEGGTVSVCVLLDR